MYRQIPSIPHPLSCIKSLIFSVVLNAIGLSFQTSKMSFIFQSNTIPVRVRLQEEFGCLRPDSPIPAPVFYFLNSQHFLGIQFFPPILLLYFLKGGGNVVFLFFSCFCFQIISTWKDYPSTACKYSLVSLRLSLDQVGDLEMIFSSNTGDQN